MRREPRLTPALLTALGFITAVGPVAVDFYLPSFTDIGSDLGAGASAVQLTLTGFLVGVACGQLLLGPLSDRLGRRRVLVAGMAVFALASAAMVFSPSIEVFVALRAVQGFAGAVGMVLGRAIAVDLAGPAKAVRPLSLIMTLVGLGPIVGPPVGGILAGVWGWRGTLGAMAVFAAMMFVLALVVIPESLPPDRRARGGVGAVVRGLGGLLREPGFRGYLVAFALGFGALMAYLSASPFVAQVVLGLDPVEYGLTFAIGASGMVVANLVNAAIAPRVGPRRMLAVGQGMLLGAGIVLVVLSAAGILQVWSFLALVIPLCAGTGLIMSNATALALARADGRRGAGSALLGAGQFTTAAALSPLVGLAGEGTAVPMAVIVVTCGAIGILAAARAARPRPPA
ncbi:multidrug effflux MFS transporter [Microbacterium limosum]|uniref:Multidrug effflux MFS transporter n=1 Tax=Microbacterium limosum TaxID=3079935 RepID=A0AAU0MIN5_9MICO|nr:multidrug effflux MFS transporter [Microbacterium sp. Y20]WOQ70111.1 multidrug effflux MFS transporter [Microbacterium sp. Y20]